MSQTFWILLAAFVVVDIGVIALVVRRLTSGLLGSTIPGAQSGKVIEAAHALIGEYLRANYSGDPSHLAAALAGLVPRLQNLLKSHGVEPRPEVIHALLEVSAARHRVGSTREILEALATLEAADPAIRRREAA